MGILCAQIAADIGIPSPAAIVKASNLIVVGSFQGSTDTKLVFKVNEFLRGSEPDVGSNVLNAIVPRGSQIIAFDLPRMTQERVGKTIILLGDIGPNGTISMKWYFASIWPSERFDTFPSDTLQNCERFIKSILKYETYKEKPAELISVLLKHVKTPDVYAAFDFMDVGLKDFLPASEAPLEKLVVWTAFAKLKLAEKPPDAFQQSKLLSMFPMLPFSVAAPHFLDAAKETDTKAIAARYVATVGTMFRARKIISSDSISNAEVVRGVFKSSRTALQREDAEIAIKAFDCAEMGIHAEESDQLLEVILGKKLTESEMQESPKIRKQRWLQKTFEHF